MAQTNGEKYPTIWAQFEAAQKAKDALAKKLDAARKKRGQPKDQKAREALIAEMRPIQAKIREQDALLAAFAEAMGGRKLSDGARHLNG